MTFTVNQSSSCGFTLSPVGAQVAATGGTGTFTVTPNGNSCTWTATSNNPDFITVTSGASGTVMGTVGYSVQPNNTQSARSGSIAVGSITFVIYQPGGQACSYILTSGSASFTAAGGTSSFSVNSTCSWTASTAATWVSLTTTTPTVTLTVAPNPSTTGRSATIMVGNQSFIVNQGGVPCAVTVSPQGVSIPALGGSGTLSIAAQDGCTWTAVSSAQWITLGATSGTGQGTVPYTVTASSVAQSRTATITVANQIVSVTQDAATCGQSLTPDHATVPASAGSYNFTVSTICTYSAASTVGWIALTAGGSGASGGSVAYTVSANTSPDPRTGTITVGSQVFTVGQSGTGCSLSLSPLTMDVGPAGGNGVLNVRASNSCRWEPAANVVWIHFTYQSINGNGRVNFTVDPNDSTSVRAGNIVIADQTFQLRQMGRPLLQFDKTGVLNSASFISEPVAPGEIITIFGSGIGPSPGVSYQLTNDGQSITKALGGVRVLFDSQPAALIYVSSTQISAIVPYAVSGQETTQMQIEYLGFPSSEATLNVSPTAPALFTFDASGSGPGAILNQDASTNSASNPASKGSVVVLWGTGEGQTVPPGIDGRLTTTPLPMPSGQVSVLIGGVQAALQYAGEAPGLPSGVLQINAVVPPGLASGAQPVVVKIGAAQTTNNVTVAIQ